jgi:hypothetical protein
MNTKADYLEDLYIDRRHQEILNQHHLRVFIFKLFISWPIFWLSILLFGYRGLAFWALFKVAKWVYMAPKWRDAGGFNEYHIQRYIEKGMVL